MGAAFAGIVRTPMTSVIMIFEVTRDYTIIVPLMIANLCSYVLAQRLQKLPIYEALSRQEGIAMPSPAHQPDPLTVDRAMRPLEMESTAFESSPLQIHPDDPLDFALQQMGSAGVDEALVVSRAGERPLGILTTQNAYGAYKSLSLAGEREKIAASVAAQNWIPAITAIAMATVLIVSGFFFWQRSRQSDLGLEAYRNGEKLIAEGQLEEGIFSLRNALARTRAHTAQDVRSRAALGLALVQSGQFDEAHSYLSEVVRVEPDNGPVLVGLGEIAVAKGDKKKAAQLFSQALSGKWPSSADPQRWNAQLKYAGLLSDTGRRNEAISLLLLIIEQRGDDPTTASKAAEMVKPIGSPDQIEQAYASLTSHFPANPGFWLRLGDTRYAAGKDTPALAAYRNALRADPNSQEAARAVSRLEDILHVDPTQRGLTVRERAERWDELLQRVMQAVAPCEQPTELQKASALVTKRAGAIELSDQRMNAARNIWHNAAPACKADPVLAHIMARVDE